MFWPDYAWHISCPHIYPFEKNTATKTIRDKFPPQSYRSLFLSFFRNFLKHKR